MKNPEIQDTIRTLRHAATLFRCDDASRSEQTTVADAIEAIAERASSYAAIAADREERIDRQAETIRNLRAELERREIENDRAEVAAAQQMLAMRDKIRALEDRVLTLSQDLERQASYSRCVDAEIAVTRQHLQDALRARDAARGARETVAAISRAGRR